MSKTYAHRLFMLVRPLLSHRLFYSVGIFFGGVGEIVCVVLLYNLGAFFVMLMVVVAVIVIALIKFIRVVFGVKPVFSV